MDITSSQLEKAFTKALKKSGLVTKKDLAGLATKDDLDKAEESLA